ncbi:NAP1-related protein 1 [Hibiscus syriacus]|uniref:NAP1-related protein 1 n=1 Tax=Hibiscus syriacus TaxID=106335 RepID=A0A6A2ZVM5_HIBSY|nr:NAP1-related protein 1 [Hibiscus syriacus]
MNSTISVSPSAPPSLPPPRPHNDPTLLKLRFQKNPCLNLNSLLKRDYFRISCLIVEINEESSEKVLEVEQKYNEIRKPIYDKLNEKIKSIPDFWLTAFLSHPALGELLNDEDQKGFPNGVDHKKKGNKRQFAEESFFTWFSDAQQKDDMDEIHDEVAEIIKEDLWPNPLTYFNNDADEEDFEDDEEVLWSLF